MRGYLNDCHIVGSKSLTVQQGTISSNVTPFFCSSASVSTQNVGCHVPKEVVYDKEDKHQRIKNNVKLVR